MNGVRAARGLRECLAEPVDVASLVMARILFGLLMLWMVVRYFGKGWIEQILDRAGVSLPLLRL